MASCRFLTLAAGVWALYFDPKTHSSVRVDGEKIVDRMKEFLQETIQDG